MSGPHPSIHLTIQWCSWIEWPSCSYWRAFLKIPLIRTGFQIKFQMKYLMIRPYLCKCRHAIILVVPKNPFLSTSRIGKVQVLGPVIYSLISIFPQTWKTYQSVLYLKECFDIGLTYLTAFLAASSECKLAHHFLTWLALLKVKLLFSLSLWQSQQPCISGHTRERFESGHEWNVIILI